MKNLMQCDKVSKVYGSGGSELYALKDVSLEIVSGEFIAITGASGSGKSTLMNILGLLDTPTSGRYDFDGQDTSTLSDDTLASMRANRIGFVFQSFNLLKKATVLRNVKLPLLYSDVPEEERDARVRNALIASGLPEDRWGHLSNELSGGQMQRVAIARALVNNPLVIFADEPTGNLDSQAGELVLETLEKLNREGRTVVIVTHEPYVAERANRTIRIRDGQIVEDKPTQSSRGHIAIAV